MGVWGTEPSNESKEDWCGNWESLSRFGDLLSDELAFLRRVSLRELLGDSIELFAVEAFEELLLLFTAVFDGGHDVLCFDVVNDDGNGGASGMVVIVDVLVTALATLAVRCRILVT